MKADKKVEVEKLPFFSTEVLREKYGTSQDADLQFYCTCVLMSLELN
jgi:hypothetical protein